MCDLHRTHPDLEARLRGLDRPELGEGVVFLYDQDADPSFPDESGDGGVFVTPFDGLD